MRVLAQLVLSLVVVLTTASASTSFAQDKGQGDQQLQKDAARGAFERGLRAVNKKNWEEALLAFERSFELESSPKTRINIALVQIELGMFVEAHTHLEAVTNATSLDSETRSAAGEQAAELWKRIPKVELELRNMLATDRLFVRGVEQNLEPGQDTIPINPGRHTINIMRDGKFIVTEDVLLREGAQMRVVLDANAGREPADAKERENERNVDQALAVNTSSEEEGGGVLESWWFWTLVGVVVVGGATAGVLLATQPEGVEDCGALEPCLDFR